VKDKKAYEAMKL